MKIKDLFETAAVGYIAKNKKEANDPRFSMSVTKDIKPGEVERQAKKFGNKFPPPLLHSSAAKNSTPNKLMNLGLTESIVDESRGVTARVQGDQYVNPQNLKDVLTVQEISVISPKNKNAFNSPEELEKAIAAAIPKAAVKKLDNNPTARSRAAIIAHVLDPHNKSQYWVRYIDKVPDTTIHGKWLTLNGYKYKSERSSSESIAIKPSDIIMDETFRNKNELAKTVKNGIRSVTHGTPDEELADVMDQAVDLAASGKIAPINNGTHYATVISKYGAEYLGPLALLSGKFTGGDIKKAMNAVGIGSFVGGQVRFSANTRQELWDSLIKTADGKQLQISTKMHTGGGAASSLAGVYAQVTPELEKEHPRAVRIMRYLAKDKADAGILKAAIEYKIIDEATAQAVLTISRKSRSIKDVKDAKLRDLIKSQGIRPDAAARDDYRIYYHALAAVANKVLTAANNDPDFSAAMLKALNNNNYLQLVTKTTVSGDSMTLDYYGKFPTEFSGKPVLFNKTYFATGQKGRMGFRLQSASAPVPTGNEIPDETPDEISTDKELPKRKPSPLTARKPKLKAATKGIGRGKRD
jgi:hypothetical protein